MHCSWINFCHYHYCFRESLRVVVSMVAIVSASFVNFSLAQSTKLCVFEERVLMIVEATRDLPGTLAATGGVPPPCWSHRSKRCLSSTFSIIHLAEPSQCVVLYGIHIERFTIKYVFGVCCFRCLLTILLSVRIDHWRGSVLFA